MSFHDMHSFNYINFIDSISASYSKIEIKETLSYFEAQYRLNDFKAPKFGEMILSCSSNFESAGDDILFEIRFNCGECFSSIGNLTDFVFDVKDWASSEEHDYLIFTIKIAKNLSKNIVNIYDFSEFEKNYIKQEIIARFKSWKEFNQNEKLFLKTHIGKTKIRTNWIEVLPSSEEIQENDRIIKNKREEIISNRDSSSHFANASEFFYIPEDFEVIEGKACDFTTCLNSLYNTLLIIFLSDFTEIKNNSLKYSLNGYKTISETIELKELESEIFKELDGIYKYIYAGGSFTDKIGLARNIISLHVFEASVSKVEPGTLDSVKSGYNLYLKDNVKQYIDIKNKLLEFLRDQSDKASEVGRGLFSSFKMKFWAFSTFFVSVFLLRSLSKANENFIDEKIVIPGIVLVIVSLVYLFIMIKEGRYEEKIIREKFDDIESRYKDLLDEKDLKSILNSDENKTKISLTINKAIITYRNAWLSTSILFLFVLLWWWKSTEGITWSELWCRLF